MEPVILTYFYNPQNNSDQDIVNLVYPNTSYPLGFSTNSYLYNYPEPTIPYALFYDPVLSNLNIQDNTNSTVTSTYTFTGTNWNCSFDAYSRTSVLATYFTTDAVATPQIFIRPAVYPTSIVYTVNSNAELASSINLVVSGPDATDYSFNPTSNWYKYTVSGLTTGCNYEAYAYQLNALGSNSPSTFFRAVTTGSEPSAVQDLSGNVIGTDVKLDWGFSASDGSAPIYWHVIRDFTQALKYNVPGTISTFTAPLLVPGLNLFSVEAVNDPGYSPRSYWSTITV